MRTIDAVKEALQDLATEIRATGAKKYFKTSEGEYGTGDVFIGVTVPDTRKVVAAFWKEISITETEQLLQSGIHEHRLAALLILVSKYKKAKKDEQQKAIVDIFLSNHQHINNWNLVDSSAQYILGAYLLDKPKDLLYDLAKKDNLWQQRTAIIATQHFIRNNQFDDTLAIAEILLTHKHDLIHKAVGWMLREVADKDFETAFGFIKKHYKNMPRTALRYAIEKFDPELRQQVLKGTF